MNSLDVERFFSKNMTAAVTDNINDRGQYDPWQEDTTDGTISNDLNKNDLLGHFYNGSLSKRSLSRMLYKMPDIEKNDVIEVLISELEFYNQDLGNDKFGTNERKELENRIVRLREECNDHKFTIESFRKDVVSLQDRTHKLLRKIKLMIKAIARLNMNDKFNGEIKAQLQQERNFIDFEKMFEDNSDELEDYEDKLTFD